MTVSDFITVADNISANTDDVILKYCIQLYSDVRCLLVVKSFCCSSKYVMRAP